MNPQNYCYQHATVTTWAWTVIQAQLLQGSGHVYEGVTGQERLLLQQLLSLKPKRLNGLTAWATLVQAWARPHDQHDVGEFLTFLLRLLQPSSMQGRWQSRLQDPQVRIYDSGVLSSPIALSIPDGSECLQDCVNAWHYQTAPHGLMALTSNIVFQIGRLKYLPGYPVRKLQVRLALSTRLRVPIFTEGLQTRWHTYNVTAGIFHIGHTPTSGHYRAFLTNWGRVGSAANPDEPHDGYCHHTLLTEDGQPAQPMAHEDVEQLYCNTYIVWCTRSDNPHVSSTL